MGIFLFPYGSKQKALLIFFIHLQEHCIWLMKKHAETRETL